MRKLIGHVIHYYNRLGVAVLHLDSELKVGDLVHFDGHTTDFVQAVGSLEINHRKVPAVGPGAEVAIQVVERVRNGDRLFLAPAEWIEEPSSGCCI